MQIRWRIGVVIAIVALGALILLGLAVQLLTFPLIVPELRSVDPSADVMATVGGVWLILMVLLGQVVLVAAARLVIASFGETVFAPATLRWAAAIALCLLVATLLAVGALVLLFATGFTQPAVVSGLYAVSLTGIAAVIIMAAMIRLLKRVSATHAEMRDVI